MNKEQLQSNPLTAVKKKEAGDKQEIDKAFDEGEGSNINFQKIPTGVYGRNDLQKRLCILLGSMGKENYAATVSGVSSTSADCGTNLLTLNAIYLKGTDYYAWCFKNKGVKWNRHTESTCSSKKRAA